MSEGVGGPRVLDKGGQDEWPPIADVALMVGVADRQRDGADDWLRRRFGDELVAEALALGSRYVVVSIGRAGRTVQTIDHEDELVDLVADLTVHGAVLPGVIELRAWLDAPTYGRAIAAAKVESVRLAPSGGRA